MAFPGVSHVLAALQDKPDFVAFLSKNLLIAFPGATRYLSQNVAPVFAPEKDTPMAKKPKIALTDRKVQSLKAAPKGERYQVMDSVVPGFGVRVTDKGVRTYILQTRFPGNDNPARREIGKCDVLDLGDAREKAREWVKAVKNGIDPAIAGQRERDENIKTAATTFSGVAEDWFLRKLSTQRSGKTVEREVRRHLFPVFEKRAITEITDLDIITKVINPRIRETPQMARQLLANLGKLYSWAIDQRVYGVKTSPCATIKPSKVIGKIVRRQRTLNDNELRSLWLAATKRIGYPFGTVYRGLALTALRLNEVAETERSEWDLHGGVWTIPAERMKGNIAHAVPITKELRALYESCPKQGKFLFSFTGGETPVMMSGRAKEAMDSEMLHIMKVQARERGDDPTSTTLPHWTNHDIRRTVRTRLSRLRIPEEAREAILAHVRPGIKGVYDTHDYLDEKREGLELWAAKLREIVEPPPSNVIKLRKRK
jgi:integrase